MSLVHFTSRFCITLLLGVVFFTDGSCFAAATRTVEKRVKHRRTSDDRTQRPRSRKVNNKYEQGYRDILDAERKNATTRVVVEDISAGAAALIIGIYGYYNDDRGILAKLAYGATQTAGVVLISNSILSASRPSLLLLTDKYLKKRGELSLSNYKRGVVNITRKIKIAEYKQLAYTSLILSAIYGYNGYREQEIKALQNVYYFLSGNFFLVSLSSFYKLVFYDSATEPSTRNGFLISARALPFPSITIRF